MLKKVKDVTVFIDKCDEWLFDNHKWYLEKSGYLVDRKGHRFHRRLFSDIGSGQEVDHVNGNTLDNRRSNLRVCSHRDNIRNSKLYKNNTSGVRGVSRTKIRNHEYWVSKIYVDGKKIVLGYFKDIKEAQKAYNSASSTYFGEFKRGYATKEENC